MKINYIYKTDEDIDLICFDESEDFYYLCRFKEISDAEVELDLNSVLVFSKEDSEGYPISTIIKKFGGYEDEN